MRKYSYLLLCVLILLINSVQAYYTELSYDEAYYWLYSQHLAWGYFDHPPAIALMIHLGYAIFPNELGIRLVGLLSNFFILLLLPKILNTENTSEKIAVLFVCASLPLFQFLGFISTPDSPLLFFSCLYFYFLKRFYKEQNYITAAFLGISMALMAYSKYHAFLLVFFTLLSNFKLIRNKHFITALIIAFLLFLPHIYWQVKNDFVSFRYHLVGRHSGYQFYHFPEYLLNVLLIFNPFMLVFIAGSLKRENIETDFHRTLQFVLAGTVLFFFACNLMGHVQPQWLVICTIPSILLMANYFKHHGSKVRSLRTAFMTSAALFLLIRLTLVVDILPAKLEFHEYNDRIRAIIRKADGRPVMFENNYRLASVFAFKTKNEGIHSYGNSTAFDQWNNGSFYHNKPVMVVGSGFEHGDTAIYGAGKVQDVLFVQRYRNLKILDVSMNKLELLSDSMIKMGIEVQNNSVHNFDIGSNGDAQIEADILDGDSKYVKSITLDFGEMLLGPNSKMKNVCYVNLKEFKDQKNRIRFCINQEHRIDGKLSKIYDLDLSQLSGRKAGRTDPIELQKLEAHAQLISREITN